MAERPQGFARRMMAQQLASDARADPFSDSRFFSGKIRPSLADMENPTRFEDTKMPAYQAGATGSLFLPGAGIADYFGKAPDPANPGQLLPGFSDNVQQGNYIDAVMQTGGAAGDVAMAAGALFPPAFPAAAALSTLLKGPRAGRLASGIDNAVDATRGDPNQVAGSAMDAAQARYFETGKFEPPTADNPVSIMPPTETEPGIIAFHGSGADFDEFRLEMIGTGEGAQAYGYGLYFTDSKDIAGFYKNMMTRSVDIDGKPYIRGNNINDELVDPDIADDLGATNGDLEAAIKSSEEFLQKMVQDDNVQAIRSTSKELEKLKQLRGKITVNDKSGKMYKVGIAPKPDELLDYDLPLSQQSKSVQEKIAKLTDDVYDGGFQMSMTDLLKEFSDSEVTGKLIMKKIGTYGKISDKAISKKLSEFGIPGIKYRASGWRGAGTADEAAERNYVIFDDKAVNIMEKYGIVGPVAITAGVAGAARSGNDNEDGGSILPDAGVM